MTRQEAEEAIQKKLNAANNFWNDSFPGKIRCIFNNHLKPEGIEQTEDRINKLITESDYIRPETLKRLLSEWAGYVKEWIVRIKKFNGEVSI